MHLDCRNVVSQDSGLGGLLAVGPGVDQGRYVLGKY